MERAGRLDPNIGGSMTFLPIIDTLQGDVTGYIQTNLVSMTDGQIYTSAALFNEGFKPAIDVGLSVSRIGSKVQTPALKSVSSKLRLEYARFKELQKLTKLRARISSDIVHKIQRGQALTELFVQDANRPVSETEMLLVFYAYETGLLDKLSKEDLITFRERILGFMKESNPEILELLEAQPELGDEIKASLEHSFVRFFEVFGMQK
jgi:F-type H+-transporting ATPase subunit alpha